MNNNNKIQDTLRSAVAETQLQHQKFKNDVLGSEIISHSEELKALADELDKKMNELHQQYQKNYL